jgi:hypothetical protein
MAHHSYINHRVSIDKMQSGQSEKRYLYSKNQSKANHNHSINIDFDLFVVMKDRQQKVGGTN